MVLYVIIRGRLPFVFLSLLIALTLLQNLAIGEERSLALEYHAKFECITLKQGLSHDVVYSITQDQQGFMWFGGEGGLVRYDGYTFTIYQHEPLNHNSLSNNGVSHILIDQAGMIWCATWGGGVNKFDPYSETFTHYRNNPQESNSLSDDRVQVIYEDQGGILWFGTFRGGLNRFDPTTEQFTVYQHEPENPQSLSNNRVWAMTEDHDGNFWVATSDGLEQLERDTGNFIHYRSEPGNSDSLSDNRIRWLYVDHQGTLWVSTDRGLNQFHSESETFTRYLNDPKDPNSLSNDTVYKIWEDHAHRLWIGTNAISSAGLNVFDREQNEFIRFRHNPNDPTSISHNDIRTLYEDRSGILWIGTRGGGINTFDLKPKKFTAITPDPAIPDRLTGNAVNAFYEDHSGILWIGTRGGGLNRYDPQTDTFIDYTPYNSELSDRTVLSIHEDHLNRLWLGTKSGGLHVFDPKTKDFTNFRHNSDDSPGLSDNRVNALYEDSTGRMWIGTGNGLDLFDPEHQIFMPIPGVPERLRQTGILSIMEDQRGTLWIGSWGGGVYEVNFDGNTATFAVYQHDPENSSSLSNNEVTSLLEDTRGDLWIGTRGGLNKFDRQTQQFTHYFEQHGLVSNEIVGIQEDHDGNLWISTINGLSKFNPQAGTFRNYDSTDGLHSDEFQIGAAYKNRSGEMFFGGIHGFSRFYPDQVKDNPYVPPIAITDFRIFDQPVNLEYSLTRIKELTLSHKDDFFSFEFAALDYTNPSKNRYAYMLEGFDKDWIYSGTRRYASYTNLDPGEYVFKVKASNDDGVWNETGIAVNIQIPPPFWKTNWFQMLIGFCVLGTPLGIHRVRIRSIQRQKQTLETQVKERTAEIEAQKIELKNTLEDLKKTQTQLIQSAKMAALGQLVSGIAHNINTPAGAIVSALDQAEQTYITLLHQFYTIFYELPLDLRELYLKACQHISTRAKTISTKERRNQARHIRKWFADQGIELTHNQSSKLAAIGLSIENILPLMPLFLNTDVDAIITPLYLLGSGQLHLRNAKTSIQQIIELVNVLKQYSYQEESTLVETNLQNDLENTLLILQNTISQDIVIHRTYENVPSLLCYADQLNQVWTNLILNAIQVLHNNGEIFLRLKQFDVSHIAVEIEDTGQGIADEILPKIFDPYFTTQDSNENRIGMGLSICRRVIRLHQGTIDVVSSQPGKTCFRVVLPLNATYPEMT